MAGVVENNTDGAPGESELLRQGDGAGDLVIPVQNHLVMAEDEPLIRRMTQRSFGKVLPEWGFSAHENGEQALVEVDLISSDLRKYLALVLSDQMMPPSGMRGNTLYREIRARGHKHVPFILASGGTDDPRVQDELDRIIASGDPLFRFLQKPYTIGDLKPIIDEFLDVRRRIEGSSRAN